jgi:uncharacterized protein (TIGR02268 family)
MSPSPPAALLALLLLGTASTVWAQPSPCQTGNRRIPLKEGSAPSAEICISPGLSTTLLFDRDLAEAGVGLEGQSRFERVEANARSMILIPSGKLMLGERLRLTVRFAGSEAPLGATFVLVVRPEAERQVDIVRAPRSCEACQAELARKEEELRSCQSAHGPAPQSGLARLLAHNVFGDVFTIPKRPLEFEPPVPTAKAALGVTRLNLHFIGHRRVVEVALVNKDPSKPWRVAGALVTSASGKPLEPLDVVQLVPAFPGKAAAVWVELQGSAESFPGTYSLQLWDEDKAHTLTLSGLNLR